MTEWGSPSASDPRAKNTGQRATKGTVLTSQSLSPWCDLSSLGQHVGVLALAGFKRRKSALTARPIERLQKRALRIIYTDASCDEASTLSGLETLHARRERIAQNFFDEVLSPEHRLHRLLPEPRDVRSDLSLRAVRTCEPHRLRTCKAKNLLLHYSMIHWE